MTDGVFETLGGAFRIQVRVPNHRRGVEWIGHLADSHIYPVPRTPSQIGLADVNPQGRFSIRALVRNAGGGSAESHPGRARICGGIKTQAIIKIVESLTAQTQPDCDASAIEFQLAVVGCFGFAIFEAKAEVAK